MLSLGLRLGLFQLSLGILGVLILGLLNRLLIQDIQLPAVLVAVAVGGQQLMGFTRAWFGHRSDRIPLNRLRRIPFIVISSLAIALLFGVACQLVLRLATSMEASGGEINALLMGLLILVFVGIGTAIAAGGTAFSALIADRTTEAERPRVLSVVWGIRLLGVLLGSVLVNHVFGSAWWTCSSRMFRSTSMGPIPSDSLQPWERLARVVCNSLITPSRDCGWSGLLNPHATRSLQSSCL